MVRNDGAEVRKNRIAIVNKSAHKWLAGAKRLSTRFLSNSNLTILSSTTSDLVNKENELPYSRSKPWEV